MPNYHAYSPSAGVSSAEPVLAALDLGTNNCRLLVARPRSDSDRFTIVDSFSRIVRLGEGVASSGVLSESAMGRTISALRVCARLIARHQVTDIRCVATEACRRASNGTTFLKRVWNTTGIELDVLGPKDEVALALLGCLPLIDPTADHVLLIDIGGGSTELAWLDRDKGASGASIRAAVSLPIGVVSLTEMFSPEPDEPTFDAMLGYVQTLLAPVEQAERFQALMEGGRLQILGTSGTVTTLAAVLLDLRRYDRNAIDGLVVDPLAISDVSQKLRGMTNASRMAHPCIGNGRADLVVAGCAILGAILRFWPADTLRVADRGLREGILHSLMGRSLETELGAVESPLPSPPPSHGAVS